MGSEAMLALMQSGGMMGASAARSVGEMSLLVMSEVFGTLMFAGSRRS